MPLWARAAHQSADGHVGLGTWDPLEALHVVGNGVDLDYFHPLPDLVDPWTNQTLVFTGVLDYPPNVQGLQWFVREVLPGLREKLSSARLLIVGRNPGAQVRALQTSAGVELIGSVPDVRTFLARAAVAIAPLHVAPGVQNKVLEAMACERAVICTPDAAAGLHADPGSELLVAGGAKDWIKELCHLLTDVEARRRIASAGLRCVESRYNWSRQLRAMRHLMAGSRDVLGTLVAPRRVA